MGKQINFYMTAADEEEFISHVRRNEDVLVFHSRSFSPEPVVLEQLPLRGEWGWGTVWLWNRTVSPPPKMGFIKQQGYYLVDEFESEVIQFLRSYMDRDHLVRGRIWAEMICYRFSKPPPDAPPPPPPKVEERDGVRWVTHEASAEMGPYMRIDKSDDFKRWFNRLASWIKRRSTRDAVGDYLLPGAAEFVRNGGKTWQAPIGEPGSVPKLPEDWE